MGTPEFYAYCGGLWDGEGWFTINVERKPGKSDSHHCGLYISQRAHYQATLDAIQAEFGGKVTIRDQRFQSDKWAAQADWHIHTRPQIERFCRAVLPYSTIKVAQLQLALRYVSGFTQADERRDDLGRIQGRSVSREEVERREALRLELKVLNERGRGHATKIEYPKPEVQHVARDLTPLVSNRDTVSRGEKRYNSVLTEDAVRAIRAEYNPRVVTMEQLALRFGVSIAAVRQVIKRVSWTHIT